MNKAIRPQPGPQEKFLCTPADICIYGGGARGGKTYGLLMEPLRHLRNPEMSAIFFRRTFTEIMMPGGAWEEAASMYKQLGASFLRNPSPTAKFPSGMSVRFAHLHNFDDIYGYQGSKLPLQLWDEVTHYDEKMFWYLVSRNTGTCGVKPYIRATCNPCTEDDPVGGWVNRMVKWYTTDEGYADPAKSGLLRWMYRVEDAIKWYDQRQDALDDNPTLAVDGIEPLSFTFIPALLGDNPAQLAADPGYRSRLMSLPLVEREQLLGGNWKIRHVAGTLFNRTWFHLAESAPVAFRRIVRYWDKAGAEAFKTLKNGRKVENKDGDRSAGALFGYDGQYYWLIDVIAGRWSPFERNNVIRQTAAMDRERFNNVELWIEQEPGNGGKESRMISQRELAEYGVRFETPRTGKTARASNLSAQMEAGNVRVLNTGWTPKLIDEMTNFPSDGWHDDQVDACSGAFNKLVCRPELGGFAVTGWSG